MWPYSKTFRCIYKINNWFRVCMYAQEGMHACMCFCFCYRCIISLINVLSHNNTINIKLLVKFSVGILQLGGKKQTTKELRDKNQLLVCAENFWTSVVWSCVGDVKQLFASSRATSNKRGVHPMGILATVVTSYSGQRKPAVGFVPSFPMHLSFKNLVGTFLN